MQDDLADPRRGGESAAELLPALVAVRICHDLAGPIGAIGNGLELAGELGAGAAPQELEMVGRSAARAASTLTALRLAFGGAAEEERMSVSTLAARLEPYLGGSGTRFSCTGEAALAGPAVRLAALMALATRGLLGRGGDLRLILGTQGGLPMAAVAEGPAAAWTDERRALLAGRGAADPRTVEFALLGPAAATAGARLEPVAEPGRAGLRALPL